ncbi:MAG: class I SAM-dependent methyltransferase [Candidatus Acidiferrales bacterium]
MQSKLDLELNSPESSVIEANVEFYRQIASKYDRYETCAASPGLQEMLNRDVDHIAMILGPRSRPVECLDCGGGTGNLTLKLLRMGWSVTVVDVSSDMLAILRNKARSAGFSPVLVHDSFSEFLSRSGKSYDVIAFSSVLQHLYSYLLGVAVAADHVEQKGVFYSAFDPVISRNSRSALLFEMFDTLLAKIAHDRSDLLPGIRRRIRKTLLSGDARHHRPVASPGNLAEYHAKTGVDDLAIVSLLQEKDFTIIDHTRRTTGRTALASAINRRLRLMESFKIIARRGI